MTDETHDESSETVSSPTIAERLSSRRTLLKLSGAAGLGLTGVTGLGAASSHEDEDELDDDEEEDDDDVAEVTFLNQTTDGTTVTVEETELPEGGYVAIHDTSLLDGEVLDSVIGVSDYIEEDDEDIEVDLFDVLGGDFDQSELEETQALIAMPHRETTDDEEYNFVETGGDEDGPCTSEGFPVVDLAYAVLE